MKPLYHELRELTRLYMAKRQLTQAEMGAKIGLCQTALSAFAFRDEAHMAVPNPAALEKLVALLRKERLMVARLRAVGLSEITKEIKRRKTTRFGRPLAAVRAMKQD